MAPPSYAAGDYAIIVLPVADESTGFRLDLGTLLVRATCPECGHVIAPGEGA